MRCALRDQEPFLCVCSWLRIDFVGDRGEDFAGDFEEDFRGEEGKDDVLFSLVSSSVFFLGEDLLKRPISVNTAPGRCKSSGEKVFVPRRSLQ